jgi:hypothetical protein
MDPIWHGMNLIDPYSCRLLSFRAHTPTSHSTTISSPMGILPGGPSPDSALPSHSKPIKTRHQAAASVIDTETHHHQGSDEMASERQQRELAASEPQPITRELPSDLPLQPSGHLARHPFSDEHASDVRNTEAAAEGSPSLGKEARRSTSVASHRTDRSLHTNDVGESVSAAGAVTAANEPFDVDSNGRAGGAGIVEEERRQKATIGKQERTFSSKPFLPCRPFINTKLLTPLLDAHRWRRPKAIENRKARGQGRENHSVHRAPRTSRDPEAARSFYQGKSHISGSVLHFLDNDMVC